MNTYKTGSYIIRGRKNWECEYCHQTIFAKSFYFGRAKNVNPKLTTWKRFHLKCGIQLADINSYERKIITSNLQLNSPQLIIQPDYDKNNKYISSEQHLRMSINNFLQKYEQQKTLTYLGVTVGLFKDIKNRNKTYKIGRKGFSDFIVFLKNNEVLFLELKCEKKRYLNSEQKEFKTQVTQLGYKYYIISSKKELYNIIYKYI